MTSVNSLSICLVSARPTLQVFITGRGVAEPEGVEEGGVLQTVPSHPGFAHPCTAMTPSISTPQPREKEAFDPSASPIHETFERAFSDDRSRRALGEAIGPARCSAEARPDSYVVTFV